MANKFVRRNTKVELDMEGNLFTVDFGRDEIPLALTEAERCVEKINKQYANEGTSLEANKTYLQELKVVARNLINTILDDAAAVNQLFAEEDSFAYHTDIVQFLTAQYEDFTNKRQALYAPNRAERRGGK